MIRPLHTPLMHGDSFEYHASVGVIFSGIMEMTDIRQSAEIQFEALMTNDSGQKNCSLFVDGIEESNGETRYSMRAYMIFPDGKSYSTRSSMMDLRREDLHLAVGEIVEDLQKQLHAHKQAKASVSMPKSKAIQQPA